MRSQGLVIAFLMSCSVLPVHAQEASKAAEKWVAAYNSGDAAAIAALFTQDAVFSPASAVTLKGREVIEKALAGRMKAGFTKETVNVTEEHQNGDTLWAVGDYEVIGSGESEGKKINGKFGEVLMRDGDAWHIVMLTANAAPPK